MKEKKNIDRIFQEKFKDFETEPNEKVWDNIASRLDKKDKKRPLIIPLWLKVGGVAAIMAIILASLLFTNNQNAVTGEPEVVFEKPEKSIEDQNSNKESSEENNKTISTEEQIAAETEDHESEKQEINSASNNNSISQSEKTKTENSIATQNETAKKANADTPINNEPAIVNKGEESKNSKTQNKKGELANSTKDIGKNTSGAIAQSESTKKDSVNTNSILQEENALAEVEKEKKKGENEEDIAELESKKMRLSTFAAPVFYKNIGSGNELSNQLSNNSTSSEVTLAYGVKIAYKISSKLKIRTGISKIDINKNIEDISYSPSAMSVGFENISPLEDNIEIRDNSPSFTENGLPMGGMDGNNSLTTVIVTPGEINQQFGYIEVPLELEYTLIDKKFGLNIIGGGSSLFLDNNRVQLISGDIKTELGEATNINNTSFSTNIGLGMDYKLTDKFSISVEPIFKYQLNTFDRVDNVQPVNFGVYSGLNFRF